MKSTSRVKCYMLIDILNLMPHMRHRWRSEAEDLLLYEEIPKCTLPLGLSRLLQDDIIFTTVISYSGCWMVIYTRMRKQVRTGSKMSGFICHFFRHVTDMISLYFQWLGLKVKRSNYDEKKFLFNWNMVTILSFQLHIRNIQDESLLAHIF